jgi:effector-binding domain-containing protein
MQPDDLTFPAYRAMLANARAQGLEITKPSMERL